MKVDESYADTSFKALVAEEKMDGTFEISIKQRTIKELPANEVLIKVHYSGLNYKDALSATGNKGITRRYPHTPGIDAAGMVVHSTNDTFSKDEEVIVTGYDLGMNTSGGFAEYISVPADWVVKKPATLTLKECMIIGTSGFTAASGIYEFIHHGVQPGTGEILVTGATGAVGSIAVAMLAEAGYNVCAATGKASANDWLISLGASRVVDRSDIQSDSPKGLLPAKWAAVLDTVGGNILSTAIKSTKERGVIANCGMIASDSLNVSVFPFILRAVRLIGIASAETPMTRRLQIWELIQSKLKPSSMHDLARIITLEDVPHEIKLMLEGKQQGKIVVKI